MEKSVYIYFVLLLPCSIQVLGVDGNAVQLQVLLMNEACGPDVRSVITVASTAVRDVNSRIGPRYSFQLVVKNLSEVHTPCVLTCNAVTYRSLLLLCVYT